MKHVLLAIFLIFLPLQVIADPPALLKSVAPIVRTEDGEKFNSCTAFLINEEKHYWVTAEHCLPTGETDSASIPPTLEGSAIDQFVMRDVSNDVVIFTSKHSGVALKISHDAPEFEQEIRMAGYPLGAPHVVVTRGRVASPSEPLGSREVILFALVGAQGTSGAPVTDLKDRLLGMVQFGWGRDTFQAMCGGLRWEEIVLDLNPYLPMK